MKFRVTASVLILTACTALAGAENQDDSFRVPGPEEIYEAYAEGLIEYQDYRELLEISRADFLTAADSAYLRQFPDLLAAVSSNVIFNAEEVEAVTAASEEPVSHLWRQSVLVRHYERIDPDDRREQLYRIGGSYDALSYHAEIEHDYSGADDWSRRFIQYEFAAFGGRSCRLSLGNFKERIGLGLMYGYHGRLFSKSSGRSEMERFVYPDYGGGNGMALKYALPNGDLKILYDTDRNETFDKHVAAVSIPLDFWRHRISFSGLYGRLRRRDNDRVKAVNMASVSCLSGFRDVQAEWELSITEKNSRFPLAGAASLKWKRRQSRLNIDIWSYNQGYPAFFCGGPSSHRSRTMHLDKLDLSYNDRYSGETGLVIKTSSPFSRRYRLRTAVGYTRRGFDDDRIEARAGLERRLAGNWAAQIVCYWRGDRLYSDIRKQGRVQLEITRSGSKVGGRLVMGHRSDRYYNRHDYLVLAELRVSGRWGGVTLAGKLDQLVPGRWRNNYSYLTTAYETKMGQYLRSFVKYTYRYRRETPGSSYGMVRIDFAWIIQ